MLRDDFLLNPKVVFLNHGSFGACPKPVFAEYQRWQQELERQPVEFLGRRSEGLLDAARAKLAEYVHVDVGNLVFVPNATSGLNVVARSLPLNPGDEILTTDHEYGALNYTWEHVCQKTGARYIHQEIPLPVTTPEEFVETFWAGVTPRTRVIFMSHITSPTALIFPVAEMCRRARQAGIMTIVDGAHAPGQIPLDLTALDVDVYSGNCHKWLCSPKGSAFLYVRPEHQAWVESVIISWGWGEDQTFISRNQRQGTRDIAAYLSVPAAIDYLNAHDWAARRQECHALLQDAGQRLAELYDLEPNWPQNGGYDWYAQMAAIPIPPSDQAEIKRRLYDDYHIEVPLTGWHDRQMVRISVQAYNTQSDIDALIHALTELVPPALALTPAAVRPE